MSYLVLLRIGVKAIRAIFNALDDAQRTGRTVRRELVLQAAREAIARRERRTMRDRFNDEAFIAALNQFLDAALAMRAALNK